MLCCVQTEDQGTGEFLPRPESRGADSAPQPRPVAVSTLRGQAGEASACSIRRLASCTCPALLGRQAASLGRLVQR